MAKYMKKGKKSKKAAKKAVMTNADFATKNEQFIEAVEAAQTDLKDRKAFLGQINPTTRMASKFRNKKGLVYNHSIGLIRGRKWQLEK